MARRVVTLSTIAVVSFLLGGFLLPHLQVRWVGSVPAAQAQTNPADITSWARTQPVALAAEKSAPSVVSIDTVSNVESPWGIFGEFTSVTPEKGAGSGVLLTSDGYVLTNDHVVEGANRITVTLATGKVLAGKIVGSDHLTDIAVVKIPGTGYPAATLGDSSHLRPGQWAIAEGNPLGTFSHTVSFGVVSALGRKLMIGDRTYEDLLQTDAAINPGNSGGPLLDIDGDVIGINTATVQSAQGISFAIPINTARSISHELIEHGKIRRAWSGLQLQDIPPRVARFYGISSKGAVIVGVDANSPADHIGFQQGDIIRKIDKQDVPDAEWLTNYLNHQAIGATVTVQVERDNQSQSVAMKLEEQP